MFEDLQPGDEIEWFEDDRGRGVPADHPDAIRRTGTARSVERPRGDKVVALLVGCHSVLSGLYTVTVRPDFDHEPRRIASA